MASLRPLFQKLRREKVRPKIKPPSQILLSSSPTSGEQRGGEGCSLPAAQQNGHSFRKIFRFLENFQIFGKIFRFSENVQIFGKYSDFQKMFWFSEDFQIIRKKQIFLWKIQGHLENNLKVKELLLRLVTCETLDQGIPRSLEYKQVLIAIWVERLLSSRS